jgi:dihydroorotase
MARKTFDLLVRGGTVVSLTGSAVADIGVRQGRTAEIGDLAGASAATEIDARNLHVLPGVIDTQVHFREPGFPAKEDLASGTAAAVLGGVTAVFEMPNTAPPTTNAAALADKLARAKGRAHCDYAFYAGATPENATELAALEQTPGCCGVKVFMGSSTGTLLVAEDDAVRRVLRHGKRRVAVHSEDEARLRQRAPLTRAAGATVHLHPEWRDAETALRATRRLLALARECRRQVHVLHVTTAEEIELLAAAKDIASVEVTPQHLTLFAPDCYDRLGTLAQMNPPIRDKRHYDGLWKGVAAGVVDVIGSDHAPHTLVEKSRPYPDSPSGMPGVQTLLPLLLDHVNQGRLSLARLVDLTSAGAERLFGIAGKGRLAVDYDADYSIVDLKRRQRIDERWLASKCGWSPFVGMTVTGWPMATVIRGRVVMRDGEILIPAGGAPIKFEDTI